MSIPDFKGTTAIPEDSGNNQEPQSMTKSAFESLGIVMDNGKPRFRLNEPAFSPADVSMRNNFSHEEQESSFVVLGKSSLDFINAVSLADYEHIQQNSLAVDYNSTISTLSQEEIEKKVVELLQENQKLKDTLSQNNNTMKHHFNTLATYQEELRQVHENHKQKFAETRDMITILRKENTELKTKLAMETSMASSRFSGEMIGSASQKSQSASSVPSLETEKTMETNSTSITSQTSSKSGSKNSVITQDISLMQNSSLSKVIKEKDQQDRRVQQLQEMIYSLTEQIRTLTENSCAPLQLTLDAEKSEDKNRKQFLENFTHYNEKLATLAKCYAAQTNRFTEIQDCLKRCIDTLDYYENFEPSELTLDTRLLHKKTFDECRSQLVEEQLKNINDRQNLIKAQNQFQKIFSDYNSVLHDLEILHEENSKPVERKPSTDLGKLDLLKAKKQLEEEREKFELEKKNFLAEKVMFQQERETLSEEKASLNSQSILYEAQMRSLQDSARVLEKRHDDMLTEVTKLKKEIEAKDIELEGVKARLALAKSDAEEIDILKAQLDIYKEDFEREHASRQELITEREYLTDQLGKLRDFNQQLLQRLNGPNPVTSGPQHGQHPDTSPNGIPIDAFCNTCGLYKMPGQWHGPGYCEPA